MSCYVTCPAALPDIVTILGSDGTSVPVAARLAYSASHTNYFGATGCSLRSGTKPCTMPATIAGKGTNFITPVVWVPRTKTTGTVKQKSTQVYTCDPVAAATANAQNFRFVCSGLPGKDLNHGLNTLRWEAGQAGSMMRQQTFGAGPLSSTEFYVLDPAKATVTTTPTSWAYSTLVGNITFTRTATTVFSSITTGTSTSTCTGTITVFVTAGAAAAAPPTPAATSTSSSSTNTSPVMPSSSSGTGTSSSAPSSSTNTTTSSSTRPALSAKRIQRQATEPSGEYDAALQAIETSLTSADRPTTSISNPDSSDILPDLELRNDDSSAESGPDWPRMRIKRAPTLGKPDAIYPPYGKSTIFVKSIHTTTKTIDHRRSFTQWPTPLTVTSTTSVMARTVVYADPVTVTVTRTATGIVTVGQ